MPSFNQNLAIETWTLYPVGLLLIAARLISRGMIRTSSRKLGVDDWLMVLATLTFTAVMVTVNQVAANNSNYLPPGAFAKMTPAEVKNAVYGSKMVFAMETCMVATTWLCKACVLFILHYLTVGTKINTVVKYIAAYCCLGYVVIMVLFLGVWCRPIQQYWQVPVDNSQCASYYHEIITSAVFNISSDLMILCVPVPVLVKLQLPLKRKIILGAIFSLGVFVILAAVLNRYYNFSSPYGSLLYLNWYIGESATSIYVANIPLCWPVLRRIFSLDTFGGASASSRNRGSSAGNLNSGSRLPKSSTVRSNRALSRKEEGWERSESEERIVGADDTGSKQPWVVGQAIGSEVDVELGDVDPSNTYVAPAVRTDDGLEIEPAWESKEGETIVKKLPVKQNSP